MSLHTEVDGPRGEFIDFQLKPQDAKRKTKTWVVCNGNIQLGEVRWFAHWRCYGFYPYPETVFERQCLRDLAEFCEFQTKLHKRQKPR